MHSCHAPARKVEFQVSNFLKISAPGGKQFIVAVVVGVSRFPTQSLYINLITGLSSETVNGEMIR